MKELSYFKYLDEGDDEIIRIRFWIDKGKLLDLVIQYESKIDDRWHSIVRFDCSHGFFNRDVLNPNGAKEKFAIPMNNLKDAANYAEQDIKDHWNSYKERYLKNMKR